VREYLEKNYAETSGDDTVKLALCALLEVVEPGSKNIEMAVMKRGESLTILPDATIDALTAVVEAEKAAAEAAKKKKTGGAPTDPAGGN
jgi:20S proteasome subunit alpha 4